MIGTMFADVPDTAFVRCLELGAGDGFLGSVLARHARRLVSTEIRIGRATVELAANADYACCDAESLPFRAESFDLIFSSHVLEHLPDLAGALAEMRRALCADGVMVHLMPTRLWKLLDLGLFFPSQLAHLIEKLGDARPRPPADPRGSTVKRAAPSWWRRSFWPPVHGTSHGNLAELRRFGEMRWKAEFERAGFDVASIHRRFPFHSPYRFGLERTRAALERLGASSTVGFVLTHAGSRPPAARLFARVV